MKFIRSLSRNSSHGFQQTFTSLSILSRVFFSDFLQGFLLKLFWKYFRIFFRKIILDFRSSARTPFTRNKYTLKIYPDYSLYFSQKGIPECFQRFPRNCFVIFFSGPVLNVFSGNHHQIPFGILPDFFGIVSRDFSPNLTCKSFRFIFFFFKDSPEFFKRFHPKTFKDFLPKIFKKFLSELLRIF